MGEFGKFDNHTILSIEMRKVNIQIYHRNFVLFTSLKIIKLLVDSFKDILGMMETLRLKMLFMSLLMGAIL